MNAIRTSVINNKAALLESLDLGIESDQEPEIVAALSTNKDRAAKSKTRIVDKSYVDLGYRFESEPTAQVLESAINSDFPKHATVSLHLIAIYN